MVEYIDAVTGYTARRYTEGPERNAKLYFTSENFSPDDRYFFFNKQNLEGREDGGCYDCVRHFGMQSGRKVDKFADRPHERGELGAPILTCAKAFYECRVMPEKTLDLGTHSLFVGQVIRAGTRRGIRPGGSASRPPA